MSHHLVGMAEIAEMLGVTRQRVAQLIETYDDFPAPEAELTGGRVWSRTAVETWIAGHPDRGPGRPPEVPKTLSKVITRGADGHFGRMNDAARRVIVKAQEEARLFPHDYIGTEHLLLALIAGADDPAARALRRLGVDAESVRDRIRSMVGVGAERPSGHIAFTPRTKKVIELSLREAIHQGREVVGPEHILLALIREGEGVGRRILAGFEGEVAAREAVLEAMAARIGVEDRLTSDQAARKASVACSFCGKREPEVTKLIAGPGVRICDVCVDLCVDIIRQEAGGRAASEPDLAQRLADLEARLRALENPPDD